MTCNRWRTVPRRSGTTRRTAGTPVCQFLEIPRTGTRPRNRRQTSPRGGTVDIQRMPNPCSPWLGRTRHGTGCNSGRRSQSGSPGTLQRTYRQTSLGDSVCTLPGPRRCSHCTGRHIHGSCRLAKMSWVSTAPRTPRLVRARCSQRCIVRPAGRCSCDLRRTAGGRANSCRCCQKIARRGESRSGS